MTSAAPIPAITGPVTVAVPLARAFELFTADVSSWWPRHGPDATVVDVEHRHFERPVMGQNTHEGITGGGWALLTDAFATMVADQR